MPVDLAKAHYNHLRKIYGYKHKNVQSRTVNKRDESVNNWINSLIDPFRLVSEITQMPGKLKFWITLVGLCLTLAWNLVLLDFENETDINPVNFIIFSDADVTSLTTWFQGLADLEYRLRRYTLSLVIGCHVDGEPMVSFLHMTSESSYYPREAAIFAEAVFDCLYNDYSVVAAFCNKRERYILDAL